MMNNRLLFFNFSVGEILVNLFFLIGSLFLLNNAHLYVMVGINLLFICKNVYILIWSYKNKLYDSEVVMQTKIDHIFFSFFLLSIGFSIKILCIYFILTIGSQFLFSIDFIKNFSNSLLFIFMAILIVGVIIYKTLIVYVSSVMIKTSNTYVKERKELIEKFKLNQDYTYFCMNDSSLTGFISSGKFYAFNKGLICHDTVFEETQVLHYLDINGINFDELNPLHIQIMRMYNI